MKTLQNNFTTPEQSKRLLELGVPADSADCYYQNALPEPKIIPSDRKYQEYIDSQTGINREIWYFKPCWSVGRLIEIRDICAKYYITHIDFKGLWFNKLVSNNWRKSEGIYIYGDCYYGAKKSYLYHPIYRPKLFLPHMRKGNAYVWFIDGAYVFEYRLIR